jgi:hypothetical protein
MRVKAALAAAPRDEGWFVSLFSLFFFFFARCVR